MKVFIDSTVPILAAGPAHADKTNALEFLGRVQRGEVEALTSTEVLTEILRVFHRTEQTAVGIRVYDLFTQICHQVVPVSLAEVDATRTQLARRPTLSPRLGVHVETMKAHGVTKVATFDKRFDEFNDIARIAW